VFGNSHQPVVNQILKYQVSEDILGYPITTLSRSDCMDCIAHWIENASQGKYFVCANPHSLEVAETDAVFDEAIRSADLIVPDGIGIVMGSKILGGGIQDRVTGSDILLGLSNRLNQKNGCSVFFLGSTEDNLKKIREKMNQDYPNITVAGTYSPPFRAEFSEEDNSLMIEAINRVKPDVLWIGMTAPKQEKWIYENRDKLDVKLLGPVGAAFDFYTGNAKRSSLFFQKIGFEWLPRFLREPRRLWRRNLVSNPRFLLRVIAQRFNNR
jgi:N-acetylglucosaminyldiphosphoundecaprenol N-acetyl-beta-D-mannosaminyltransferase